MHLHELQCAELLTFQFYFKSSNLNIELKLSVRHVTNKLKLTYHTIYMSLFISKMSNKFQEKILKNKITSV